MSNKAASLAFFVLILLTLLAHARLPFNIRIHAR